jgi:hypothetical protein
MYDPLIVDTFIAVHTTLAVEVSDDSARPASALTTLTRGVVNPERPTSVARLDNIAASTEETLVLYDLARALTGYMTVADVGAIVSKHIRRVIPASICVLYVYDTGSDELHATYAAGESAADLVGIRIPRGQRLSGWVAANKQTILNSDPVLDLGDVARAMRPRLHSCLSTPLITDGELLGVLTLYTGQREAFSEDHRRVVEAVAGQVGHSLKQALGSRSERQDTNALPTIAQLEKALAIELSSEAESIPASLVFIRCECPRAVKAHDAERTIAIVLESIAAARGTGHPLFQYRSNEFVLLLTNTDAESAASVARRIASILSDRKASSGSRLLHGQVTITIATAPKDGLTLSDLASASSARNTVGPLLIDLGSPSVH